MTIGTFVAALRGVLNYEVVQGAKTGWNVKARVHCGNILLGFLPLRHNDQSECEQHATRDP